MRVPLGTGLTFPLALYLGMGLLRHEVYGLFFFF